MNYYTWAIKWGISQAAVDDLRKEMGLFEAPVSVGATSEAGASQRVRLDAAYAGDLLWRNNVGACEDTSGNFIRYGLANESKAMNEKTKSSDLVGITQVLVTPQMVGYKIGQFTAREVKKPGWKYTGTPREIAQRKFGELVIARGGDFKFTT